MAQVIAARQMLMRMSLAQPAAEMIIDPQGQGLSNIADFLELDRDTSVEVLCKVLRRPGGTTAAGVANHGVSVSAMAETNLSGMVYFIKHRQRIGRTCEFADVLLPAVRRLYSQRDMEEAQKDPQEIPTVDTRDWPSTLEAVVAYIDGHRGVDNHPLGYVIRDQLIPTAAADDPTVRAAGSTYFTHDEELRARATIVDRPVVAGTDPEVIGPFSDTYIADRKKVYELLCSIFQNTTAWIYLKKAKKYQDGRMGYKILFNHYLGPNNVDHMASAAERALSNSSYSGERKGWNFEKLVTHQTEQHGILERLTDYGYSGIDKRSKVRHLIDSVKTTSLDTVKTRILSDETLRQDYDACVTLYTDFLKQSKTDNATAGIAAFNTDDKSKKTLSSKVEDKFYPDDVWKAMSYEDKKKVGKLRWARKQAQGKDDDDVAKYKSKVAALEKKLGKQKKQISALKTAETASDSEESDTDEGGGNRKHSALTRQKKRPREGK